MEGILMPPCGGVTEKCRHSAFSYYVFPGFYAKFDKSYSPLGHFSGHARGLTTQGFRTSGIAHPREAVKSPRKNTLIQRAGRLVTTTGGSAGDGPSRPGATVPAVPGRTWRHGWNKSGNEYLTMVVRAPLAAVPGRRPDHGPPPGGSRRHPCPSFVVLCKRFDEVIE